VWLVPWLHEGAPAEQADARERASQLVRVDLAIGLFADDTVAGHLGPDDARQCDVGGQLVR
jgi:hypothetical protein